MTSLLDKYRLDSDVKNHISNNEQQSSSLLEKYSQQSPTKQTPQNPPDSNESIFSKSLRDIFKGLPGQIALGLTQAVTSPLDLMKLWMTGEALTGLDEAEEAAAKEGIPFDREKEQAKILNTIETSVPTLSMAEKWLNEQNVSTNPQNALEGIARAISEFTGLPKVGKSPKLQAKSLAPEQQALRETAEEFGLRKFAGMEAEKPPTLTPIVSAKEEAKLASELGESSKKAIDDLIDQKISVKKYRDEYGINLEEAYDKAYDAARSTAKEMGDQAIDYSNVIEWIDKEIAKTKASSASLSDSQKTYIKVLNKEKKSLLKPQEPTRSIVTRVSEREIPAEGGSVVTKVTPKEAKYHRFDGMVEQAPEVTTNLVKGEGVKRDLITGKPIREFEKTTSTEVLKGSGDRFDLIIGKKIPQSTKNMTADQSLNQIKNYNSNVKGIYRKPEFAGKENAVKNAYAGLNEQFIQALEKANPQLAKETKFANKIFHETSKLEQVEGILNSAFKDGYNPKKLGRTLEGRRNRKFLERSLGKDGVRDLERIAKYGQEAEKKVLKQLENPKTIKEYLNTMTPGQLALLVGAKAHAGAIYYIPKAALHRFQGMLFTRDGTKKAYMQFLKDASKYGAFPLSQTMIKSSRELQNAIEEEFGSEEALLNMSYRD